MTTQLIVAGISTEIGKTVSAAVLVEALAADYWKPVQSGELANSDTHTVRDLVSNSTSSFHSEAYRLTQPVSPHAAAEMDGVTIELNKLSPPKTDNSLIIELAGGLMVPLNNQTLNIDLVHKLGFPVVLVSRNYLGSINHTLLSVEACRSRQIPILGILFNGPTVSPSESYILQYTGLPCIGRIGQESSLTKAIIRQYATAILPSLNQLIESFQQKF